MDIPPLLLQTLVSLAAILLLAGLAVLMKLGGQPLLASEADLRRAASEVCDGFDPVAAAASIDGAAGLALDQAGRIVLIKRHGNRFAGRILSPQARAQRTGEVLEIDCGERLFGRVALTLDDPAFWKARIDAMESG